MDGINIDDLTIEQYLRLTQEHQTPSMVKKVDDMTIAEYMEYEERIKRQYELDEEARYTTDDESVMSEHETINPVHTVNTQSFKEELSLEEDLDEWTVHKNKQIRVAEADLKKSFEAVEDTVNNDSFTSNLPSLEELNLGSFLLPFTSNNYNSYGIANVDASNNVIPRSIYEYMKLANLGRAAVSFEMDDMTQQETLGTMKNIMVKINKFEFPCDFVVTEMPENLRKMIILGRPFLKTIHAQIDVLQEEISLGIEVLGKSKHGMLRQWVCFRDHERRTVKGSCMGFADFLQVHYGNQRIDDKTCERRYYEWVAQNYEFDNNRTSSTTTVSDKCPYKTNYPTPIPPDEWDTRCQITYTGSTSNQNIRNNDPTPFPLDHSELGEKANVPAARRKLSRPTQPVIVWWLC
uniref:Reverse transcriptase domain-containing protein n=1 Tax=Tanacetum cinerariifolium TaxID=118510 RepID=A0A6L2NKT9_TANCI|nr:hypothetical protein [Tanacetum cinerariifolium]GEX27402.1 hypothetical protein [Tanacetum cinerariifolium]